MDAPLGGPPATPRGTLHSRSVPQPENFANADIRLQSFNWVGRTLNQALPPMAAGAGGA